MSGENQERFDEAELFRNEVAKYLILIDTWDGVVPGEWPAPSTDRDVNYSVNLDGIEGFLRKLEGSYRKESNPSLGLVQGTLADVSGYKTERSDYVEPFVQKSSQGGNLSVEAAAALEVEARMRGAARFNGMHLDELATILMNVSVALSTVPEGYSLGRKDYAA